MAEGSWISTVCTDVQRSVGWVFISASVSAVVPTSGASSLHRQSSLVEPFNLKDISS